MVLVRGDRRGFKGKFSSSFLENPASRAILNYYYSYKVSLNLNRVINFLTSALLSVIATIIIIIGALNS